MKPAPTVSATTASAGGFSSPLTVLVAFGVERFIRLGAERHEADAPRGVAAGVLKMGDLLHQFRLAGARGGGVQQENVVQNAHQHLQPFALAAPELFNFQPQRGLFAVVHFLHELGKFPDFFGHLFGDFLRAAGDFFGLRLNIQPFIRGGGDLRGEFFEVLDFLRNGAERAGFNDFDNGAVIQNERQRAEQRAERDARRGGDDFPAANRMRRLRDEKIRRGEQQSRRRAEMAIWGPSSVSSRSRCQFRKKPSRAQAKRSAALKHMR